MNYELLYILLPKINEDEAKKKAEQITTILKEESESIVQEDFWGMKDLAYEINHYKSGYYVLVQFVAKPDSIAKIEAKLKQVEEIVRYLITRYDGDFVNIEDKIEEDSDEDTDNEEEKSEVSEKKDNTDEAVKKEEDLKENEDVNKDEVEEKVKKEEKKEDTKEKVAEKKKDEKKETKKKDAAKKKEEDDLDDKLDKILEEDIIE